ncbi:MAG TPA: hypothetical protein PKC30_14480 [Saprospiraceae bacterium]|nr:hypothetical protein [Saprospiraceae bacterium]
MKQFIQYGLFLCIAGGLFPFVVNAQITVNESKVQANIWMQEQEYLKALHFYENCFESDVDNFHCMEQAGIAAYRLGILHKARNYFHRIENEELYFKSAYIHLSNIYEIEENIPKAINYNRMLKDSFPENPLYCRKLGQLYMKARLPVEAMNYYQEAIRINSMDIVSLGALADLWTQSGQFRWADSLIRIGLSIDEENIAFHQLNAKNYYKQRMYDSTVLVLDRIIGKVDFTNYYNKLMGFSLLQIDSVDRSIIFLERSLVNEGDPEYAHYYLGLAYEKKDDMVAAIHHLNKAVEAGTSNNLALYFKNLGRIHSDISHWKEAIQAYEWSYRYIAEPILLYFMAEAASKYYKDNNIAIRYYERYLRSSDNREDIKIYSREKIRFLKEMQHLTVRK